MNISVKIVKENKDGSADAVIRYDKESLETLVQWGLIAMLTEAVDRYKPKQSQNKENKAVKKPVKRLQKVTKGNL